MSLFMRLKYIYTYVCKRTGFVIEKKGENEKQEKERKGKHLLSMGKHLPPINRFRCILLAWMICLIEQQQIILMMILSCLLSRSMINHNRHWSIDCHQVINNLISTFSTIFLLFHHLCCSILWYNYLSHYQL